MIHGYKPNGWVQRYDGELKKYEFELRQCVHCQYSWSYGDEHAPEEMLHILGHPTRRGYCTRCDGYICCRAQCFEQQQQWTEEWLAKTGINRACIPFEEWNSRLRDTIEKKLPLDPELTVSHAGLIVPRSTLS